MKKVLSLLLLVILPLMACSADYTEGDQYTKVSEKKSSKAEVREYF